MQNHSVCRYHIADAIVPFREVLECFKRQELLDWSGFQSRFGPALREGVSDGPATAVFQAGSELGEQQWEDFRKRVIEHVRTLLHTYPGFHLERGAKVKY